MRTFLCIPISERHREFLAHTAMRIRSMTHMRASWVPQDNYHITLRFLGDMDPSLIVDLDRCCRDVAARIGPFECTLDRIGAFPSPDRARVIWVGGALSPSFERLAHKLSSGLSELGFPPTKRESVIHATLARIKDRPDPVLPEVISQLSPIQPLSVVIDRMVLMESTLTAQGSAYTPLFTKPLGGTG
ncbi:RNA 2',3'-cyclic phosphodiesterase [Candidatus Bipolaricaulota bacterium]|nr:RNA 2',3'-cyclic phosphodiesterase [Candidatus Bipolaricaulota bacterium]